MGIQSIETGRLAYPMLSRDCYHPTLSNWRDVWSRWPLADPPIGLSEYENVGEEFILSRMGVDVRHQLDKSVGLELPSSFRAVNLDHLAKLLEERQVETVATSLFGRQRESFLTKLVGLPYREFTGVMLRGMEETEVENLPVCSFVRRHYTGNGDVGYTVDLGIGEGAQRLELRHVADRRPHFKRWVSAKLQGQRNGEVVNWEVAELTDSFGFADKDKAVEAIKKYTDIGFRALSVLQEEYNVLFHKQVRRRGLATGLITLGLLALYRFRPLLSEESAVRTPTLPPSPTKRLAPTDTPLPNTAVSPTPRPTDDFMVLRQRFLEEDETLLRTGRFLGPRMFENNLTSGVLLESGPNTKQQWYDTLHSLKENFPQEIKDIPLGILRIVRKRDGSIPQVVMETEDGKRFSVVDLPGLAVEILEWTWRGESDEDKQTSSRILGDVLSSWQLDAIKEQVVLTEDVYSRLVIRLPLTSEGGTASIHSVPLTYAWGPERLISPVLKTTTLMSDPSPSTDGSTQSAVVKVENRFGTWYLLIPPGEYSSWLDEYFKTHDMIGVPMHLKLIGQTSRLQDTSGNPQAIVGFAALSFTTDTKAVEGVYYSTQIPCLPIFVPKDSGSWNLQRMPETLVQNDQLALATSRNPSRITRPLRPTERQILLPKIRKTVFQRS